jgi:hypothetical protein
MKPMASWQLFNIHPILSVISIITSFTWTEIKRIFSFYTTDYIGDSARLEFTLLRYASMINKDGYVVDSSVENIEAAIESAINIGDATNYTVFLDQSGPNSWPVPVLNYLLLRTDYQGMLYVNYFILTNIGDCTKRRQTYMWLIWALVDPNAVSLLAPAGYADLPASIKNTTSSTLYSHTCDGKQILYTEFSGLDRDTPNFNAFLSLACIFLLVALVLGVTWQLINQSRCSSMVLVYQLMLMSGIIMTYISVIFLYKVPTSDNICNTRVWLPVLGYTLILVATFERTWQMHTVYEKVRTFFSVKF